MKQAKRKRITSDKTAPIIKILRIAGTAHRMMISTTSQKYHQNLKWSVNGTAKDTKEAKNTFTIPKRTRDSNEMVSTLLAVISRNG